MSELKFYIHDMIRNIVVTELSLEDTKEIIHRLFEEDKVSFNVFEYKADWYNLLFLDGSQSCTVDFTLDENRIVRYKGI